MSEIFTTFESFKESLLTEKIYDVYHGTNDKFDTFDYDKIGTNTQAGWNGLGFYFSDNKAEASLYGDNLIKAKIELKNPIDLTQIKDDSNIQGYDFIKFISNLKGFGDIKYNGMTIEYIISIIDKIERDFEYKNIWYSEGTNPMFRHVWYEYDEKEYVLRNKTDDEINEQKYLKDMIISRILYDKYSISDLPMRISELMHPSSFTKIAKENGYDGVIAFNSTMPTGNEYVVFDNKNIKII